MYHTPHRWTTSKDSAPFPLLAPRHPSCVPIAIIPETRKPRSQTYAERQCVEIHCRPVPLSLHWLLQTSTELRLSPSSPCTTRPPFPRVPIRALYSPPRLVSLLLYPSTVCIPDTCNTRKTGPSPTHQRHAIGVVRHQTQTSKYE